MGKLPAKTLQPALSKQGTLNQADLKSLVITAVLFGASAVITSLSTNLSVLHLSETQSLLATTVLGVAFKVVQKLLNGDKP